MDRVPLRDKSPVEPEMSHGELLATTRSKRVKGMQTNAIDAKRDPISFKEMQTMLKWSYGDEGLTLAESWRRWNERLWEGRLQPVPIIQPTATPYGHWIGLYSYNHENQSLSIQLKRVVH